jgi:hypothetical protein
VGSHNPTPAQTLEQIEILKRFALLEAGVDEVRDALAGVFEFDFVGTIRTAGTKFRVPEPGVIVTRVHIHNAIEQQRLGKLSERELIAWASVLLLNDAFELDPNDQEFVAEWLNNVSFNGHSGSVPSPWNSEPAANSANKTVS